MGLIDVIKGIFSMIGLILGLMLKPFAFVWNTISGASKEVSQVKKFQDYKKLFRELPLIFFTNDDVVFGKFILNTKGTLGSPEFLDKLYKVKKTYRGVDGKKWVVIFDERPESMEFNKSTKEIKDSDGNVISKGLKVIKGTKPYLVPEVDKVSGALTYSVKMSDYAIKGGELLTSVGYEVFNTVFLALTRPFSQIRLRDTQRTYLAIGIVIGFIVGAILL